MVRILSDDTVSHIISMFSVRDRDKTDQISEPAEGHSFRSFKRSDLSMLWKKVEKSIAG